MQEFFKALFGGLFGAIGERIQKRRERKAREEQREREAGIITIRPGAGEKGAANAKAAAEAAAKHRRGR